MCFKYCLTFKYLASYCNTLVPSYKLSHVTTKLQSMDDMWLNISSSINEFHCMTYHCVYLSSSSWVAIKSCTFNGGLKPNFLARFQRSTRNKPTHTCIICCTIWISYTYDLLVLVHTGDDTEQVTWIITEWCSDVMYVPCDASLPQHQQQLLRLLQWGVNDDISCVGCALECCPGPSLISTNVRFNCQLELYQSYDNDDLSGSKNYLCQDGFCMQSVEMC